MTYFCFFLLPTEDIIYTLGTEYYCYFSYILAFKGDGNRHPKDTLPSTSSSSSFVTSNDSKARGLDHSFQI